MASCRRASEDINNMFSHLFLEEQLGFQGEDFIKLNEKYIA